MADMSGEQMQAKITAARREAEGLKDKIKRRKDELADTSRATPPHHPLLCFEGFLSFFSLLACCQLHCAGVFELPC